MPSAIRGNLVAHRPLDRSLSFPQAGIVNVVNSVSDTDPCRVSCRKAQEIATGSEQIDGVVKSDKLSHFVYCTQVSSPPITRHLIDLPQASNHKRLLLCEWRVAPPVLIPPDLALFRVIILEPVLELSVFFDLQMSSLERCYLSRPLASVVASSILI